MRDPKDWLHISSTKPVFDCGQQLGEGWTPPGFFALDTQDEKDNHSSYYTGSVVFQAKKDRAFHYTSGRRYVLLVATKKKKTAR